MYDQNSLGYLFKKAFEAYADKYQVDSSVCGIKLDLRPQGYDLTVGIRFVEGKQIFSFCSKDMNCLEAKDEDFKLLDQILEKIGVTSESGAAIMIKRNAVLVYNESECQTIEADEDSDSSIEAAKKREKFLGIF